MPSNNQLVLEDVTVILRNFSGEQQKYNAAGDRNFGILLDTSLAEVMEKDGWNVKWFEPREEGDPPQAWLRIFVKYTYRPPKIFVIDSFGNQKELKEDAVDILDDLEFDVVDVIINPSSWEVNGKTGIKAYLAKMYVTPHQDALDRKYAVNNNEENN